VPDTAERPAAGTDLALTAADGYPLAATWYPAAAGSRPTTTVVLNGATAVPRRFYDRFARFLAAEGFSVLTYDYRGIAGSRPPSLRGFRVRMRDWGELDAAAALRWVKDERPADALAIVGHSAGGQLLGIIPGAERARALVLVSSQSGWWRHWPAPARWGLALLWHGVMPVLARTLGYFPSKRFGLGEDLPGGVAREWARWCRNPHYMVDDEGEPLRGHASLTAPVLSWGFSDDTFAPRPSLEDLLGWFGGAEKTFRYLTPADLGVRSIGHFGFFREGVGGPLWPQTAQWLRDRTSASPDAV
jgi:predicted alpha/beta hydrolase